MQLIKNIQGEINTESKGELALVKSIVGSIQLEDYINIHGFSAYLQNLTKTEYTESLTKPLTFGLKNQSSKPMITLEITTITLY